MKAIRISYFLLLTFLCLHIPLSAQENVEVCETDFSPFSKTRLDLAYYDGEFIATKREYVELGLWTPWILTDWWFPFTDFRGYGFGNGKWGASAGIGIRTWGPFSWIFGANLYYDFFEGQCSKGFHRLGVGVEWLGSCWDIRANGYLPIGKQIHHHHTYVVNNDVGEISATCVENEFSFAEGLDAELGAPLISFYDFMLYGALGPYYYRSYFKDADYWGGQARLELSWRSCLTLQFRSSYDSKNKSRTQGKIMISIPFDFFQNFFHFDYYQNLIFQPVQRNGLIFTNHRYRCKIN